MPMNLPTLADLQDLYGAGSVSALNQAEQQYGLAQQYAQGELQGQEQEIQSKTLKNMFDTQQNPQLIEQRRLENIGLGNKNTTEGVAARRAAANEGMQLTEDQHKFALNAQEHEIKSAELWAEGEMRSGNPQRMTEAKKILDFTASARTARAKAEADMLVEQERSRSHLKGIGMQTETQRQINKDNIDACKFAKKDHVTNGISGIQAAVAAGKMTAEKAAVAFHGAAMFEADPDLKQQYETLAQQYEQLTMNIPRAGSAGKLDIGAVTGQPTTTVPPALGTPKPAAQAGHALADLKAAYPGKSEAELKAAYKRKFGVDPR